MAYSTVSSVQNLIKWCTFSSTSKVTTSEITNTHIVQADAFIDGKLNKLYQVPITDLTDVKILEFISARIAACQVAEILVLQTSGELPKIVEVWQKEATERLQEILNLTLELPNTVRQDSTRGLYSYTAGEDVEAIWQLARDQW